MTGTLNNPPVISNQTRSIAENSGDGTAVGAVIAASDSDADQTLSYSIIGGNTANTFAINATTGQLTVTNSATLNYEITPSCSLIVQVSDNGTPVSSTTATMTVNVPNVNEFVATITSQTNVNCNGSASGAATVTASGETTPYTYVYRNTTTNTALAQSGSAVTGLTAGTYSVTVTASFTIAQPTAISLTTSSTRTSKAGSSDGTASVSVSGGTPGYSYDWTPGTPTGDETSAITSLSAGSYSVTITDSKACTAATSLTVTTAPDLTPLLYVTPSLAYSTTTGSVVVVVFEINSAPTSGTITVHIAKSSLLSLSFNPGATSFLGRAVQNSLWTFDGTSNSDSYILTTAQPMGASGKRSIGLISTLTPGQTKGRVSVTATLVGGSGGEVTLTNNTDADQVEYFNK